MVDFEKVFSKHVNDDGNIPADSIPTLIQAVQKVVGDNFVTVDRYNAKKTLADDLQTKLDETEGLQGKYDTLKTEFEAYKNEQTAKELRTQKQEAYKEILKKIGIPEKRFAVILKTVDFDELDFKDGKFVKAEELENSAKDEWSDFIVTKQETGVDSPKPPENNGGTDSKKSRALELAQKYQEQMYGKVESK